MLEGLNSGRPLLGIGKSKDGKIKKYKKRENNCENDCMNGCANDSENKSETPGCGQIETKLDQLQINSIEASDLF